MHGSPSGLQIRDDREVESLRTEVGKCPDQAAMWSNPRVNRWSRLAQTITRNVLSRSMAASRVSSRLQKQKRMYCRPSALSWKKLEPGTVRHAECRGPDAAEGDVVGGAEGGEVGHDVVGPVGDEVEADVEQGRAETIAPGLVVGRELGVVRLRHAIGERAGFLERGRRAMET